MNVAQLYPTPTTLKPYHHIKKLAWLVDGGSVLATSQRMHGRAQPAAATMQCGLHSAQRRRERLLTVRGVGQGVEKCTHNCVLPVTLNSVGRPASDTFDTPTAPRSQLPAILGLSVASESRMIIDATQTRHLYGRPRRVRSNASPASWRAAVLVYLVTVGAQVDSMRRVSGSARCYKPGEVAVYASIGSSGGDKLGDSITTT